jgi:hypothetical protein
MYTATILNMEHRYDICDKSILVNASLLIRERERVVYVYIFFLSTENL